MRLKSSTISIIYQKSLKVKPGVTQQKQTKPNKDKDSVPSPSPEKKEQGGQDKDKKKKKKKKKGSGGSGKVTNLMSVDAQRLQDLMSYVSILFSAPFQITLALYFLFHELGSAVFAGVTVMIVMIPVTYVVSKYIKQQQRNLMEVKDSRIKVTQEILSGMSILKM